MPLSKIHRLMIIGSSGVGKTAIIEHLIFGNHIIGVSDGKTLGDTYEAVIETEPGNEEAIQIYDTPGGLFSTEVLKEITYDQEHYLSIGDGIVLVYDIASKSSFDLVKLLRQKIALRHKEFPVVVIGNKYDLDGIRQVNLDGALDWARAEGVQLYETSVLDRDSLKEPFSCITWSMANPGRIPPTHFQSSFTHSHVRKSFTIPQTRGSSRHRHHQLNQEEPLLSSPSSVDKEDTPPPFKGTSKRPISSPKVIPSPSKSQSQSSSSTPVSITKDVTVDGRDRSSSAASLKDQGMAADSPLLTTRSISSATSDYSFDSRISSHVYPEDAMYPRTGLLGLADCMSSRGGKDKKNK